MSELETYVVALQKQGLLLPKDAVAEIIPYEPLQRIEELDRQIQLLLEEFLEIKAVSGWAAE